MQPNLMAFGRGGVSSLGAAGSGTVWPASLFFARVLDVFNSGLSGRLVKWGHRDGRCHEPHADPAADSASTCLCRTGRRDQPGERRVQVSESGVSRQKLTKAEQAVLIELYRWEYDPPPLLIPRQDGSVREDRTAFPALPSMWLEVLLAPSFTGWDMEKSLRALNGLGLVEVLRCPDEKPDGDEENPQPLSDLSMFPGTRLLPDGRVLHAWPDEEDRLFVEIKDDDQVLGTGDDRIHDGAFYHLTKDGLPPARALFLQLSDTGQQLVDSGQEEKGKDSEAVCDGERQVSISSSSFDPDKLTDTEQAVLFEMYRWRYDPPVQVYPQSGTRDPIPAMPEPFLKVLLAPDHSGWDLQNAIRLLTDLGLVDELGIIYCSEKNENGFLEEWQDVTSGLGTWRLGDGRILSCTYGGDDSWEIEILEDGKRIGFIRSWYQFAPFYQLSGRGLRTVRTLGLLPGPAKEVAGPTGTSEPTPGNGKGPSEEAPPAEDTGGAVTKPHYDKDRRRLTLGGKVLREFKQPAQNQEVVLIRFEEEGWPPRIKDPTPSKASLNQTVRDMNRPLKGSPLRFFCDGTGEAVRWELRT